MGADELLVDPVAAAHRLLGATLTGRGVRAIIVEVEAYGGAPDGPWPDAAAHSYRGPSGRNLIMFGPPGRLYTYRSHGIHVCANVVCGPDGTAAAVLLRAAALEDGADVAWSRRGAAVKSVALARGPGNLCSALGIIMADNGIDLFDPAGPVTLRLNEAHGAVWVRASASVRPPTGRGVCGSRAGRRSRPTGAARERRPRVPATS